MSAEVLVVASIDRKTKISKNKDGDPPESHQGKSTGYDCILVIPRREVLSVEWLLSVSEPAE